MNRARISLLIAGLCLAGAACDHVQTPETVKIPLQSCSGLPCFDATFGGTKLKLLLSLADQTSYLSPLAIVKADSKRPAKEIGKVRRFKVGSLELSDLFAIDDTLQGAVPKGPETLNPPADGTLSYNAFSDRLVVLNIPGHVLEISAAPLTRPACPANCSQLHDSRATDMGGGVTLTTDGFAAGNVPLRARVDTVFPGAVAVTDPIKGLRTEDGRPAEGTYHGSTLSYLEAAPIYFAGKPVASSASVVRANDLFSIVGPKYDSAVGLAILSAGTYAFDFRSMKMWRRE
ncbi:MAG: hypothetical protein ACJ746_08310 [Bryobacteraceae bacterium]